MGYSYSDFERDVIDKALRFANVKKIELAEQVYEIFGDVVRLRPGEVEPLKNDHAELCVILGDVLASPKRARKTWHVTVDELVQKAPVAAVARFVDGQLSIHAQPVLDRGRAGVEAAYGFALALLLDAGKDGSSLRRCAWAECDNYFLSVASSKGGPKAKYCCTEHRREADRAEAPSRVKAWRAAQKRKPKQR